MEYTHPPRKALILGAVIVGLNGLQQEFITAYRRQSDAGADTDWAKYMALKLLASELRHGKGENFVTEDVLILDMMARIRQTLGVSYPEWESLFPNLRY